jgi:Na+-transporting methylmalonyl-CoA/oxaloacetate decarboxylase gamma subunit
MGSDLIIGLRLSVIGFSLTFLALGLLILVMVLLLRFFPDKSVTGQKDPDMDPTKVEDVNEQRLEEMAVALAVGICLLERSDALDYRDPSLGRLLEQ